MKWGTLRLWARRELDLDRGGFSEQRFEVFASDVGTAKERLNAARFLCLLLRQALQDGAVALNIFVDNNDECLRCLEYFGATPSSPSSAWRELAPAPSMLGGPVLAELRRRGRILDVPGWGLLAYRERGRARAAGLLIPHADEARVFLTEQCPVMRTKLGQDATQQGSERRFA